MRTAGKIGSGLAVLVAGLGLAPLAAPAGAAVTVTKLDGYKYVTKSFELPPGRAKTYRVACPERHHVLGGGHYNSGGYGDVIGAHSYPYDSGDAGRKPDDGWAAQLRGFTKPYPAEIYAICAKLLPEYESSIDTVPTGSGSADPATGLKCDNTSLDVLSGGTRGPLSVREVTGYPVSPSGPDRWVTVLANHGTQVKDVTLLNVCAGIDTDRGFDSGTGLPETQQLEEVGCPPATPRVIGGGTSLSGERYNTAIAASRPNASFDGWRVWIDNYNPFETVDILVYAICSAPR